MNRRQGHEGVWHQHQPDSHICLTLKMHRVVNTYARCSPDAIMFAKNSKLFRILSYSALSRAACPHSNNIVLPPIMEPTPVSSASVRAPEPRCVPLRRRRTEGQRFVNIQSRCHRQLANEPASGVQMPVGQRTYLE